MCSDYGLFDGKHFTCILFLIVSKINLQIINKMLFYFCFLFQHKNLLHHELYLSVSFKFL